MTGVGDERGRRPPGRVLLAGLPVLVLLAGCTMTRFDFAAPTGPSAPELGALTTQLAEGETFGTGPVRVALLLPLTGSLADVGLSMANGAKLAMAFIEANPNIAENITIVLKDTGDDPGMAANQASAAVAEGASLILGPLRGDQVASAGAVARSAGIPLIGFSNNSAAAQPGVFLLNVLPETEARRALAYAKAQGRGRFAGVFPDTLFGRAQQDAFSRTLAEWGLPPAALFTYASQDEAEAAALQLAQLIESGAVDAIYLPDRASAPRVAGLLGPERLASGQVSLIGSTDWDGDPAIGASPALVGAIYPSVDDAGYRAILPEYQQKFVGTPHRFATLSYTATILANAGPLSMSTPRYDRAQLTLPAGFNGRDGVFRFTSDGRSQYALVINQVVPGGRSRLDGPKL